MDYIFHLFFRHGIIFKEASEDSEKVTKEMTASWEETTLPIILARYHLKDFLMQMYLVCSTKHCDIKRKRGRMKHFSR